MDKIIIDDKTYVNKSFMIMKKHFGVFCGTLTDGDDPDLIVADEIPNLDMARGFIHGYIEALNTTLSENYEDVSVDFRHSLINHGKDGGRLVKDFSSGFYLCILNQDQEVPNEDETEFMFFDYNQGSADGPYYSWFDVTN